MTSTSPKPYRIGVALSGGGAKGFAHVGSLKALEEYGIKPDALAGVSAGSVVAVMYAAGVPLDKMMKLFTDAKFRDFCEFTTKRGGFFSIDKFKKFLRRAIGNYKNIEDLPIPVHIGVTDLDNGKPEVFTKGDIVEAVAASCSIPIIFRPVEIDGVRYVDGGVLRNMPSWVLRENCECLIGFNCSPLPDDRFKNNVMDIALRTYRLMLRANVKDDMMLCDLAIESPEIASYKVFNLKEIQQVYIRGYATTKSALKSWPMLDRYKTNTITQ
ncbi:MAG: patatin-like phospholipase family protein [Barnesiella sp.]|nr:patatin-like phospholipase family protein [Barnesiella sp.]MBD5257645.1 patatin-like phospholipase family protein [Barnesiella sp.]